jgi:thymidylate synthase ThyX
MYLRFAIRTWDSIDSMLALIARVINPLDDWTPIIDLVNSDYWQLDREERLFAKFDGDCVWITVAGGVDADQLRRLELSLISAIAIPERVNLSQPDTNTLNRPSFQLPCWTTDNNQIVKLVGSVIQASISELRPNNQFFAPILDSRSNSYQLDRVGIWRLSIDDGVVKTLEISGYHASDSVLSQMRTDLITAVNAHANMFFDPATNVWAPKAKPEFDPMDSRKTLTTFIQQSKIEMDIMLKNDPELWWAELDKVRIKQRELLTLSPVYDPLADGLSALQLIDVMGLDLSVVNDARSSFKKVSAEFDSKDRKLLSYLANANPPHFSPFRGCVLKFRVSAPLSICRQWWKHAVASSHVEDQLQHNEQCISGNQQIRTWWEKNITVKELFDTANKNKKHLPYVRSVNEHGEIIKNKIADVWESGKNRAVYKVISALGFEITCTDNHRFLTPDGSYKELNELVAGDLVMMNGVATKYLMVNGEVAYKNADWLRKTYVEGGLVIKEVAEIAGCTEHCIRKYLALHNIHLSRQAVSDRSIARHGVYGKGLTKKTSPVIAERGRKTGMTQKGVPKAISGENHHEFKGDKATPRAGHHRARKLVQKEKCSFCEANTKLHIHHIDENPLNNLADNLIVVCRKHHNMLHGDIVPMNAHAVPIKSIELVGYEDVYDIQMEGESNIVVGQFVVHNSFRYTEVTQPDFYTPTQYYNQSANNRQASDGALHPDDNQKAIELVEEQQRLAFETYRALIDLGVSREDARNSLPVGTYTTWTWTVSLQALVHFIELRKGNGAQHQIVAYAQVLDEIVTRLFPEVAYACLRDLPEVD